MLDVGARDATPGARSAPHLSSAQLLRSSCDLDPTGTASQALPFLQVSWPGMVPWRVIGCRSLCSAL